MDVGLMHLSPSSKADPAIVARHAETLGFESYWVGDHTIIPVESSVRYPGARPGQAEPDALWQLPDPLVALARAAAVTSRIKLATGILLVPERNPILTAKQIATLDDASGGRFLFGIGAGWNPEESTILGGDFPHRWSQAKEFVAAMKVLWTEDLSEYHGKYVDFPPVKCFPKPAQKPHPPILIGSINNPKALQRVVDWGDGWVPVLNDVGEFAEGVRYIKAKAKEAGRDPAAIDFTAFGVGNAWLSADKLKELESAGANRVVFWVRELELDPILRELDDKAKKLFG
jgi:probable F420-dependent oxidoreductase